MTIEARLDEIERELDDIVARRQETDAATLELLDRLGPAMRELGETLGALCWVLRRQGLVSAEAFTAARAEMLTEFERFKRQR